MIVTNKFSASWATASHLILLINQIHYQLHHNILVFGLALGDEQGEGDQGIVGEATGAVGLVEAAVLVERPHEEEGGNALSYAVLRLLPSEKEWFLTTK